MKHRVLFWMQYISMVSGGYNHMYCDLSEGSGSDPVIYAV